MRSLALSVCLACGGTAAAGPGLQATLRDVNSGLRNEGLILHEDGWLELTLSDDGWTRSHELEPNSCLTAVALSDELVSVHVGLQESEQSDGASWISVCAEDDARSMDVRLEGPPETAVAFALFTGPVGGDAFARSYFQTDTPPEIMEPVAAEPAPSEPETLVLPTPTPTPTERCDDDEAREHYRRGMRFARENELGRAADALALAYACHADGTILFNLASVTAQQGNLEEAREMFVQLLRDHPNVPDALRAEVDSALDSLRRPGTLIVSVRRGDQVFINGVEVEAGNRNQNQRRRRLRVRVLPGTHRIVVRSGARRFNAEVRTEGRDEVSVDPRNASNRSSGPPESR